MKVLLELLGDVSQLLSALDDLESIRPESRAKMRSLLETLHDETARLAGPKHDTARREEMFGRALEAIAHQRLEEAREILEAAVEVFPDDCELHNHLGLVAWESGDIESAERHYRDAVVAGFPEDETDWFAARSRPFLRAMEGRALALYRLGRAEEALGLFDSLASMNPAEFAGCRYLAGEIRHKRGEVEAALGDYRLVPTEPAVLYNIGLALFQLGRREEAAQTWVTAFVANRHIAHALLRRPDAPDTSMPGFLASESYAAEFVDAVSDLWGSVAGSRAFLARCYDHPLVQAHLVHCTRRVMEDVLQMGPGGLRDGWYHEVAQSKQVGPIVKSIMEHMDS